jgi:hypothetical protein
MIIKLNENQITDALLGIAAESAQEHLASCAQCLQKVQAASSLLSGFGKDARREAERNHAFWARQGLAIMERNSANLQTSGRRSLGLGWAWGAAATAVAALVLWVSLGGFERTPPPSDENPVVATEFQDNDEVLLRQVEAALERGAPVALAPAEVLTRELHRRTKPAGNLKPVSVTQN